MGEMLRCPKCGHGIDRANPVCAKCGAKLKVKTLRLPETPVVKISKKALDENEARLDSRLAAVRGFGDLVDDKPKDPFSGFSVLKGCAKFMRFCQFFGWCMIALTLLSGFVLSANTVESGWYDEKTQMAMMFGETWIGWVVLAASCLPLLWLALFSKEEVEAITMQVQAGRRLRIAGSAATGNIWYRVGVGGALGSLLWGCISVSQTNNWGFAFLGLLGAADELVFFWFLGSLCRLQTWSKRFAQKCMELPERGGGSDRTKTCQGCGKQLEPEQKFCPDCGKPTATEKAKCRRCGKELDAGQKFCPHCGTSVAGEAGGVEDEPKPQG